MEFVSDVSTRWFSMVLRVCVLIQLDTTELHHLPVQHVRQTVQLVLTALAYALPATLDLFYLLQILVLALVYATLRVMCWY
jgi:hypothetical protein